MSVIHLWGINVGRELIELLSRMESVEKYRSRARSANCATSDEIHASSVFYARVIVRHFHGEARFWEGAGFFTVQALPTFGGGRWKSMVQIMVEKLTPLHDHVSYLIVCCDIVCAHNGGGNQTCRWFWMTIVSLVFIPTFRVKRIKNQNGFFLFPENKMISRLL